MLAAALLVIPVIAIEESHVSQAWKTAAEVTNWVIWTVFAAEVVAYLAVIPGRRLRWLRENPLEVAIVVLTPPFLPASLQALRAFRCSVSSGFSGSPSWPAQRSQRKGFGTRL